MACIGMSCSHLKTSKYLANNSYIFLATQGIFVLHLFTCGLLVVLLWLIHRRVLDVNSASSLMGYPVFAGAEERVGGALRFLGSN